MFGRILLISDIGFLKPKYKKVPTDNIVILWNQKVGGSQTLLLVFCPSLK